MATLPIGRADRSLAGWAADFTEVLLPIFCRAALGVLADDFSCTTVEVPVTRRVACTTSIRGSCEKRTWESQSLFVFVFHTAGLALAVPTNTRVSMAVGLGAKRAVRDAATTTVVAARTVVPWGLGRGWRTVE